MDVQRSTTRGFIAGAAAAAALAVWFLVIDGLAGQAFHTPAFLASLILARDTVAVAFGPIAIFTVIHFAVFLILGVVGAWLLDRFDTVPVIPLGLILGFLLFDLLFYGGVAITGTDVVHYLGWAEVLVGNIIAGLLLVFAITALGPTRTVTWGAMLAENRVVREGVIVGLIGAAAVAAWYLVLDLISGQVFLTPAILGSVIFRGATSLAEVQLDAVMVIGYTGLHLLVFLVVGLIAAALGAKAEQNEVVILGALMLFVTFETFFIGVLVIIAEWLLAAIPWWTIAVANLIAAVSMGWYLWRSHPRLRAALQRPNMEQ